MLVIIYLILGYWAVPRTIYRNRIVMTTNFNWFCTRLAYGTFLGFILIPLAIVFWIFDRKR